MALIGGETGVTKKGPAVELFSPAGPAEREAG
jgi:hypothetical protein